MAVEMIGGPRLCQPLLATGLGRFIGAASKHANGPRINWGWTLRQAVTTT